MQNEWVNFSNKQKLINHGPAHLRSDVIDILAHAIRESSPYLNVLKYVARDKNHLIIGQNPYDLRDYDNVYIIGAGKATQPISLALEEILSEKLSDGIVILKEGESHYLKKIRIIDASHPIPNEASLEGAIAVQKIAKQAIFGDLVISVFTGGSSALMALPAGDITLSEKQLLNKVLLECGASIREINAVRKHVSKIKGGHLGNEIFPADLVNLTVSDVIGDPLDFITDPTVPDTSTYEDAIATLDKYILWDILPVSITQLLLRGVEIETPKSYDFPYKSIVVVPSDHACQSAALRCKQLGYDTHIITTEMEGESCQVAVDFVQSAMEVAKSAPQGTRVAVLASGETTVHLNDLYGEGGRNQEFALSSAFKIAGLSNVVVAALAPDGTDGPTDACGGLVDGETINRAIRLNLKPEDALLIHSSKELLNATGDLLISGPTGTNVNDVVLMLIET